MNTVVNSESNNKTNSTIILNVSIFTRFYKVIYGWNVNNVKTDNNSLIFQYLKFVRLWQTFYCIIKLLHLQVHKMSNKRRNDKIDDSTERQSQAGVADAESLSQKVMDIGVAALRDELSKGIDTALQIMKDELTKQSTETMNQMDERITLVEQRVSALESQATASACTHEVEETEAIKRDAREAIVIANDVEQYTWRNNIRVRGLAVPECKDCKDVIINFLSNKLRIRNVTDNDIEAAHILPTRNNRETGSRQRGSVGPNGDGSESGHTDPMVIIRFRNRELRDSIMKLEIWGRAQREAARGVR